MTASRRVEEIEAELQRIRLRIRELRAERRLALIRAQKSEQRKGR